MIEAKDNGFEARRKRFLDEARERNWPAWFDFRTGSAVVGKDTRNPSYAGEIPITKLGGRSGNLLEDLADYVARAPREVIACQSQVDRAASRKARKVSL